MSAISKPLVSVLIVSYNQKKFLEDAIESVLLQDYEPVEIIVADDGSKDGTHEMLKEYADKYPGKFILSLADKNQGITNNCNSGYFKCNGKYMATLGGDDLMLPGKLSKQVAFLENNPEYNLAYHNLDVFDSDSGRHMYFFNNRRNGRSGYQKTLIKYGTINGACATMIRMSEAPRDGFDIRMPVASDWFFWIGCLNNNGKIGYIDEVLGKYRQHNQNVTASNSPFAVQGWRDMLMTCDFLLEKYPQFKKETRYRQSLIYRDGRKFEYAKNLIKSLKYNPFNIPSLVMLATYFCTFKKVKL